MKELLSNILNKLKSSISDIKTTEHSCMYVYVLLSLVIFIKLTLLQGFCFHSILISSLWKHPLSFFDFWLPKLGIALLFAIPALIIKRHRWTILISVFVDVLCIADIIYFRAYGSFLDWSTMQLAGNMDGFWESIFFFTAWKDTLIPLITVLYSLLIIHLFPKKASSIAWKALAINLVLSYCVLLLGVACFSAKLKKDLIDNMYDESASKIHFVMSWNPFSLFMRTAPGNTSDQVYRFSVLHTAIWIIPDMIWEDDKKLDKNSFDEQTKAGIAKLHETSIDLSKSKPYFKNRVILLIVESLESWAINDVCTPNLCAYMREHNHIYAPKIGCQVGGGMSADGQMIINTGLLPILNGTTCYDFPLNAYPSLGECCEGKSVCVIPHKIDVWNQHLMSPAYSYDTTMICSQVDSMLCLKTVECLHAGYQMIQTITMSSHAPFTFGAERSHLSLPSHYPSFMANYMKSINYFDSGLKILLDALDNDTSLTDVSLVITGDHVIFPDDKRNDYADFVRKNNLPYSIDEPCVPLIIFAFAGAHTHNVGQFYQMDIFPTLLHLVGCEEYYWKGFGINILDGDEQRSWTPEDARYISDKLIRSNYFAEFYDK